MSMFHDDARQPMRPTLPTALVRLTGIPSGLESSSTGAAAHTAAPGALFDLRSVHPGPLPAGGYEPFGFAFVATLPQTTVTLAFPREAASFYVDDAAVVSHGSQVDVSDDPGLESSPLHGQRWRTETVGGCTMLSRVVATTVGSTYSVTFWLGADAPQPPPEPQATFLGYAQGGLPAKAVIPAIPEPSTYVCRAAPRRAFAAVRRGHRRASWRR